MARKKQPIDPSDKIREQVHPILQSVLIVITMSIVMGVLLWRVNSFRANEALPEIKPMTPAVITELGGFSGTVDVGLYIDQFQKFSMVSNQFIFDGIVWFKFNPGEISLDTIEKFSFENGTLLYRSPADTKIEGEKLLARYNIRLNFSSDLNYKEFPMDDHRIDIILTNKFIEPSEVFFKSEYRDFSISTNMDSTGWDMVDREVETGYLESILDPQDKNQIITYPAVVFSVDYSRSSIRYTLSILLPLALMFFLTLYSLSLPLRTALASSAGGVTAILAYRFVIENLSPRVGFFMVSDFIFFLFLGITLLVFIINVAECFETLNFSSRTKIAFSVLLHLIIIVSISYLILW